MFFLLRSAFWLGVVFTSMPWNGEISPGAPQRALASTRAAAISAGQAARDYCSASPAECLSAAQKLHELFERVSAGTDQDIRQGGTELSAQDRQPAWRGKRAGN